MNKEVLDIKDVMQRVQDDKELLLELLDIFEGFYPEKRVLLDELVEKKNFDQIKDIVHSIKGAAGNISAKAMHISCQEIEKLAQNKDLDGITAALTNLDKQFDDLKVCIASVKKEFQG